MAGYSLISNSAVRELASIVLFENVVQNIMVVPGRSADFKYVEDINAKTVTVNRPKLVDGGRTIGDAVNGGFFNSETGSAENQLFDINLTQVYDKAIKIAQVQDDMSGGTALKGQLMNVPKAIARFVNRTYLATVISASMQKAIVASSTSGTVSYTNDADYATVLTADTTAGTMEALNKVTVNFGKGDINNGFDIFDLSESCIYASSDFLGYLRGSSNFIVNNPIGQQMIASGSFTAFDVNYRPDAINGYQGEIYGMLLYHVGSLFVLATGAIGLETIATGAKEATNTAALSNLLAVVVNGRAIGGGMTPGGIKVVDARGGQGWEVQPLARCGFDVFSEKGVQTIWKNAGYTATHFVTYTGSGSTATQTKRPCVYQPDNRSNA